MKIRTNNIGVYKQELTYCDGSNSGVMSLTECTIPVSVLKTDPFNLPWGTDIYVKVIATNSKGNSRESKPGHGAVITTTPDAPLNLNENFALRTSSSLGLIWDQGVDNGGDVILDYRLWSALQGETYTILASGIVNQFYTVSGLSAGTHYQFKVQARNSYGYSSDSLDFNVLCASAPDSPEDVVTAVIIDKARFTWSTPANNGATITGYKVYIREHLSDDVYSLENAECDGTASSVI